MFCSQCGAKNADSNQFCGECGAPVTAANGEQPAQNPYPNNSYAVPQYQTANSHAKATGGLQVWLWIMIVSEILVGIYSIIYGFNFARLISYNKLYTKYAILMFVLVPIIAVIIFGAVRLLNGYKHGFYILCACVAVTFILNLIINNWMQAFAGLISPAIVWLLAKDQWKYFR